jgi:hypothetical protein
MFDLLLPLTLPVTENRHAEALATAFLGLFLLLLSAVLQRTRTLHQTNGSDQFTDETSVRLGEETGQLEPSLFGHQVLVDHRTLEQLSSRSTVCDIKN